MRRRSPRSGGFSLVELAIASSVAIIVMTAGIVLADTAGKTTTATARRTRLTVSAAQAVDRIARELSVSSFRAEDSNGNGISDSGEDVNNNGRLDSDWSIPDASSGTSITFNAIQSDWTWGGPVTYAVRDGRLWRTENGSSLEVCRSVQVFNISRNGSRLDILLRVSEQDGRGERWADTARRRAHVRN